MTKSNSVSPTPSGTAHITVPPITYVVAPSPVEVELSDAQLAKFEADVREMLDACPDANANERAVNLITACLGEGMITAGRIITFAKKFDFDRKYVGALLRAGAGKGSATRLWRCDREGRFSLLA